MLLIQEISYKFSAEQFSGIPVLWDTFTVEKVRNCFTNFWCIHYFAMLSKPKLSKNLKNSDANCMWSQEASSSSFSGSKSRLWLGGRVWKMPALIIFTLSQYTDLTNYPTISWNILNQFIQCCSFNFVGLQVWNWVHEIKYTTLMQLTSDRKALVHLKCHLWAGTRIARLPVAPAVELSGALGAFLPVCCAYWFLGKADHFLWGPDGGAGSFH